MKKNNLLCNISFTFRKLVVIDRFYLLKVFINIVITIFLTLLEGFALFFIVVIYDFKMNRLFFYLLFYFLLIVILWLINLIMSMKINISIKKIRLRYFYKNLNEAMLSMDYEKIEDVNMRLMVNNAEMCYSSENIGIENFLNSINSFILNLVKLLVISFLFFYLDIFLVILIFFMSFLNFLFSNMARKHLYKNRETINKINNSYCYNNEYIADLKNINDVKIYKLKDFFVNRVAHLITKRIVLFKRQEFYYSLPAFSDNLLMLIRDFIIYILIFIKYSNSAMAYSILTLYISVAIICTTSINGVIQGLISMLSANDNIQDYRNVLNYCNINIPMNKAIKRNIGVIETIEFRNVSYIKNNKYILNNVSFKLERGKKYALIGLNGAGKSTIIKLISGLYTPTSGMVLINNTKIQDLNLNDINSKSSILFQDTDLFPISIRDNIILNNVYNEEIFKKSLEISGVKEDLKNNYYNLNDIYTQLFSEKGIGLSRGQKQKILLARVLYKKSDIVLLDEPTSSLDVEAEKKLYSNYNRFLNGNITVFVSHKAISTEFCDYIIVLSNGKIQEIGTHQTLMEHQGFYYEFYNFYKNRMKED